MEEWFLYSLASCFLYSLWAIFSKLASRTVDTNSFNLLQLPIRVIVTVFTALHRTTKQIPGSSVSSSSSLLSSSSLNTIVNHIGDLNLYGSIFTVISCVLSVFASFLFSDALEKGDASSVAVVTGSYPALSYIISVIVGLEQINLTKLLGVCLAIGSCYCFAIS